MQEELLSGEEEDKNIKQEELLQNTPNKGDEKKLINSGTLTQETDEKKIINNEVLTQDPEKIESNSQMKEEIYFPQDGSS